MFAGVPFRMSVMNIYTLLAVVFIRLILVKKKPAKKRVFFEILSADQLHHARHAATATHWRHWRVFFRNIS